MHPSRTPDTLRLSRTPDTLRLSRTPDLGPHWNSEAIPKSHGHWPLPVLQGWGESKPTHHPSPPSNPKLFSMVNSSESSMTFTALPDEIQGLVFSFVRPNSCKHLLEMHMVAKGWGRITHIPRPDHVLQLAARSGYSSAVRVCLASGADVHAMGENALLSASEHGHVEVVQMLLKGGACVHAGAMSLRKSSRNGHTGVVRLLLEAGADVNAENNFSLLSACRKGHTEVIQMLLAAGADVHALRDRALELSSLNGHVGAVRLLLEMGADVHVIGDYILKYASKSGHTEVVDLLQAAIESSS